MTDLKKLADEYAAHGKVAGTEAIRRRAYLAGARAALEIVIKAHDAQMIAQQRAMKDAETPAELEKFKLDERAPKSNPLKVSP